MFFFFFFFCGDRIFKWLNWITFCESDAFQSSMASAVFLDFLFIYLTLRVI